MRIDYHVLKSRKKEDIKKSFKVGDNCYFSSPKGWNEQWHKCKIIRLLPNLAIIVPIDRKFRKVKKVYTASYNELYNGISLKRVGWYELQRKA